jgi:hypothetical protein
VTPRSEGRAAGDARRRARRIARFDTSGRIVADMDPDTQKWIVAARALRDVAA